MPERHSIASDDSDSDQTLPYDSDDLHDLFAEHQGFLAETEACDVRIGNEPPDPCHFAGLAPLEDVRPPAVDEIYLELLVLQPLCRWTMPAAHDPSCHLAVRFYPSGQVQLLIEKELNILTAEEARAHREECWRAMLDELKRWVALGALERASRGTATNLIDARWVLKWKVVDGTRLV